MSSAKWNSVTRIRQDPTTIEFDEKQSSSVGSYRIDPVGTHQCETSGEYDSYVAERGHMYKQYRSACRVDSESELVMAPLTNPRLIHELATRPYSGAFMGAGTRPSESLIDSESGLIFSKDSREGSRNVRTSHSADAAPWWSLPNYGNPQRVEHIVPETWVRGGANTREDIRKVDYDRLLKAKSGPVM